MTTAVLHPTAFYTLNRIPAGDRIIPVEPKLAELCIALPAQGLPCEFLGLDLAPGVAGQEGDERPGERRLPGRLQHHARLLDGPVTRRRHLGRRHLGR